MAKEGLSSLSVSGDKDNIDGLASLERQDHALRLSLIGQSKYAFENLTKEEALFLSRPRNRPFWRFMQKRPFSKNLSHLSLNTCQEGESTMPPLFLSTNFPTTSEAIHAFELKENIILPDDYKQFLLKYNGGTTRAFVEYVRSNDKTESYIDGFLGLTENNELFPDLEFVRNNMKQNFLPLDLLYIASTESEESIFVLKVREEIGKVFVWFTSQPEYRYAVPLADSFTEFFEMIQNYDYE